MLTLDSFYGSPSTTGGLTWSVVAANTTAENNNGYIFDNSQGSKTLTLPGTPPVGATVGYKDLNGYFASFPLTITGGKINGMSEDMVVDSANSYGELVYSGSTNGWVLTSASVGTPVVTKPMMQVQWREPQGTAQPTINNGDRYVNLNYQVQNDVDGASLSSNTVTLPAGTYYVEAIHYQQSDNTTAHLLYFQKSDGSINYVESINTYGSRWVHLSGQFTISSSETFRLRGRSAGNFYSGAISNAANISGRQEIYADLRIWKLDSDRIYNPRVFQPINQPVSNAYVTGNIFGGELVYNNTTSFNVNSFSCMADDLATPLFINSTTLVTLTSPVLNTIYHAWAVKYNTGTYGVKVDTDINGANLGATVVAKRWLGFVRTNASVQICKFTMMGDSILFTTASENVISSSISTTFVQVDHSPIIPVARVENIMYGVGSTTDPTGNSMMASDDGVNISFKMTEGYPDADTAIQSWGKVSLPWVTFKSNRYFKTMAATQKLLCHAVKVRR
jgi:hypothetical protein